MGMNCPVCDNVRMREVEKYGVLIDVCPNCKGVWLDRGELDKILGEIREVRDPFNRWLDEHEREHGRHFEKHPDMRSHHYGEYDKRKKKRRVFDIFEDLFD
ncbi:cytoplasmic protein [Kyrpidia spormannii]|uniref:Cytoplasmic protein n=2 Tax=Kyrpidia spormannii TaxID=2055160 RepID=A0A2K8N2M9_9BACL|nr:cytoplasmic protein [Kyrpidia spormannii]